MTFSFDEYVKNNKGALVKNDATTPTNPVDDGTPDVTGGAADPQREKVNKSLEKEDASHGDKASVVKEGLSQQELNIKAKLVKDLHDHKSTLEKSIKGSGTPTDWKKTAQEVLDGVNAQLKALGALNESKDGDDDEDDQEDDEKELNESAKEAFNKNRSAKVGDKFVDSGNDQDSSGTVIANKDATILVAYEDGKGNVDILIVDGAKNYSDVISLDSKGKTALKKFL